MIKWVRTSRLPIKKPLSQYRAWSAWRRPGTWAICWSRCAGLKSCAPPPHGQIDAQIDVKLMVKLMINFMVELMAILIVKVVIMLMAKSMASTHRVPSATALRRLQEYLAHKKPPHPPLGPPHGPRNMLLQVPRGRLSLMSEVPLYRNTCHLGIMNCIRTPHSKSGLEGSWGHISLKIRVGVWGVRLRFQAVRGGRG